MFNDMGMIQCVFEFDPAKVWPNPCVLVAHRKLGDICRTTQDPWRSQKHFERYQERHARYLPIYDTTSS
jgi:hypothetical protein